MVICNMTMTTTMPAFIIDLFRALTTPDGSVSGELLSERDKTRLLRTRWGIRPAATARSSARAAQVGNGIHTADAFHGCDPA